MSMTGNWVDCAQCGGRGSGLGLDLITGNDFEHPCDVCHSLGRVPPDNVVEAEAYRIANKERANLAAYDPSLGAPGPNDWHAARERLVAAALEERK